MPEDGRNKPRLLCFCPRIGREFPVALLEYFDVKTVHDAPAALVCARTASYDCYLAYGVDEPRVALDLQLRLRDFDQTTPFAIVSPAPPDAGTQTQFRPGFDIYAPWGCSPYELLLLVQCLLDSAELRSLRARVEEERVISEEINQRMHEVEHRMHSASASIARAEGYLVKARAMKAFTDAGGAPAHFHRYWPETFNRALVDRGSIGL